MSDKINGWWLLITAIITGLLAASAWLYDSGAKSKQYDGRTFDSPEQKVEHIYHVKSVPTPNKQREKAIFDSIQIAEIKKLLIQNAQSARDVKKHVHHLDSVNLLTSDQIYQLNQKIKSN